MDRLTLLTAFVALLLVACGPDDLGPPGVVQEFRAERVQAPVPSAASVHDLSDVPLLLLLSEIGGRGFDLSLITKLTAQWTEPSSGAPVAYYILEYEARGSDSMLNMNARYIIHDFYDVSLLASLDSIRGRVAGVDMLGRVGEWRPWSEWHLIEEE